jgi:glycosyltransferase involved in cell wall biosynthesis
MYDFSIITVNLDNLDGLKKTIKSINSQTYKNFEHIIIDGNSIDGSVEFIKSNSNSFIVSCDDGIYDAMNKGIAKSSGKLICFLNSGDILYPDSLNQIKRFFNHEVYDFAMSPVDIYSENNKYLFTKFPTQIKEGFKYLTHMPAAHMSFFVKKSIFNSIGNFDLSYEISSDFDFINRLFRHTSKYLIIKISIGKFFLGGISSSYKTYCEDFLILRKNNFPTLLNLIVLIKKIVISSFKKIIPARLLLFIENLKPHD